MSPGHIDEEVSPETLFGAMRIALKACADPDRRNGAISYGEGADLDLQRCVVAALTRRVKVQKKNEKTGALEFRTVHTASGPRKEPVMEEHDLWYEACEVIASAEVFQTVPLRRSWVQTCLDRARPIYKGEAGRRFPVLLFSTRKGWAAGEVVWQFDGHLVRINSFILS